MDFPTGLDPGPVPGTAVDGVSLYFGQLSRSAQARPGSRNIAVNEVS